MKWSHLVTHVAPHGLAGVSGSITDVGIVGYTSGGGVGPMARTHGINADKVRAIEVVTGDGEFRRVTPESNPDLFFALRGQRYFRAAGMLARERPLGLAVSNGVEPQRCALGRIMLRRRLGHDFSSMLGASLERDLAERRGAPNQVRG